MNEQRCQNKLAVQKNKRNLKNSDFKTGNSYNCNR